MEFWRPNPSNQGHIDMNKVAFLKLQYSILKQVEVASVCGCSHTIQPKPATEGILDR